MASRPRTTTSVPFAAETPDAPADVHVVILAGGEGTRLWPLSRSRRPKQLLSLVGDRSLIQQTVERVLPLVPPERVLVVTEQTHAADLQEQLPQLPPESIIVEPTRRNTAGALLLAALHLAQRAPATTWASLHSDAFILDDDEFRGTLAAALQVAADGQYLVTTGVRPQAPATAYGYIQRAEQVGTASGYPVHRVARFVEKPDLETARSYILAGDYLWNPGVFAWKNATLLDAFRRYQPVMLETLTRVPLQRVDEVYPGIPRESIDTGIMERADNLATIPATFRWADIGSWAELWEVSERDAHGNVVRGGGRVLQADSENNLVYAQDRAVALVGARDLVVIETADAVFVCPRDRALDVKLIVQGLQRLGATELL
jgi:mannose-1-phosphate guanylyltransferase